MAEVSSPSMGARERRVREALRLGVPDRVPVSARYGFFPARYAGITIEEFIHDPEKMWDATWKTIRDFPADLIQSPFSRLLGPVLEDLDCKQARWAGRHLPPDGSFQFVEGEYMKPEEYEALLADPSDFVLRTLWPRIFGALEGLSRLAPLRLMTNYGSGVLSTTASFALPEVVAALEALRRAGENAAVVLSYQRRFTERARAEGFVLDAGAAALAPFDVLGDFFRGTRGILLDLYRRPEVVTRACEALLPFMLERAEADSARSGNPRVFIPLHKGTDRFLSREQFLRFYWPTLRALLHGLIDRGLMPCPFLEGAYASRLDIVADVPPGKACYSFEATDMRLAKEALGGRVCLRGNVPGSLLATGTPEEVKAYCRDLIETVGRGGGFILDTATSLDDARPENVRAMFEAAGAYE